MHLQEKGSLLPKFGEWDVNDPASAEGFTVIFNKARDEKKTGGNSQGQDLAAKSEQPSGQGLYPAKPNSSVSILFFPFPSHGLSNSFMLSNDKMEFRSPNFQLRRKYTPVMILWAKGQFSDKKISFSIKHMHISIKIWSRMIVYAVAELQLYL